MPSFDTIIVGQGLAGTTLAWHLLQAGQSILVIDACQNVTSSKIAAGLITPITGLRLTLSATYSQEFLYAAAFYKKVEDITGTRFFHQRTAVRYLRSEGERSYWSRRQQDSSYLQYVLPDGAEPQFKSSFLPQSEPRVSMRAAQLDVSTYLKQLRTHVPIERYQFDWKQDVSFRSDGVEVLGHTANRIISCEGFAASQNPYFSDLHFNAAKGDILTVEFEEPMPACNLHRGIWIAPTKEQKICRVGATYNLDTLDQNPMPEARKELEERLQEFVKQPYRVLDHVAAVRPIISKSHACVGQHPDYASIGLFNGLGSKGSLLAPYFANMLTRHLMLGAPIPADHHLEKWMLK